MLHNAIAPGSLDKVLLLFPDPWPKTRHQKRRIVQPEFASLISQKLKTDGFDTVFICSLKERHDLINTLKGKYFIPLFPTIGDLASYIYESTLFVGNDSGPAHLASALNIPTVTIMFHKRNFYWRPDFSQPNIVILPPINIVIGPKSIWKWFVLVSKVYRETKKLIGLAVQ